jgi:hypothetical protein
MIVFNARLLITLFRVRVAPAGVRGARCAGSAAVASAVAGWHWAMEATARQPLYLPAGLLALAAALATAAARFPRFGPALKMGVAYPRANRFRTGMTIAMFSLIVFSLTVFSAINSNFSAMLTGDDGDGGYQVVATTNTGTADS